MFKIRIVDLHSDNVKSRISAGLVSTIQIILSKMGEFIDQSKTQLSNFFQNSI